MFNESLTLCSETLRKICAVFNTRLAVLAVDRIVKRRTQQNFVAILTLYNISSIPRLCFGVTLLAEKFFACCDASAIDTPLR